MKRKFSFIIFLLIPCAVFAAIPLESSGLRGEAALQARLNLIEAAEKYLGTPYRYSGYDASGLDCSGLVSISFRDGLRVTAPRSTGGLFSWVERIPKTEMKPGDLVFFATGSNSSITHVGIYAGNNSFIHAASEGSRTGVIYSSMDEVYWNRAYSSSGRALPWDNAAETALADTAFAENASAGAGSSAANTQTGPQSPNIIQNNNPLSKEKTNWASSTGFFAGGGISVTTGRLFSQGSPIVRGLAGQVKVGYKGLLNTSLQIAFEARPQWDREMGIVRLPLTLSFGNDRFQVFAGPAFTFGEPVLQSGEKYHQAYSWLGELGFSASLDPISIGSGALSLFAETAWQPYKAESYQYDNFGADFAANFRLSLGVRYMFLFGKK